MTSAVGRPGVVREAGPAEWPQIAGLTTEVYRALTPAAAPRSWTAYLHSIASVLLTPDDRRRLVVDVHERIAASVLLCPPSVGPASPARGMSNPHPELRLLAVGPDHRHQGLAGRLIQACEEQARRDGHEALTLHTTGLMPTAQAMYERRGYRRAPELDFRPDPDFVVWGYRRPLG